MATIEYEAYRRADLASEFGDLMEQEEGRERDFGWLSSFNVPVAVELKIRKTDLIFNFRYSDEENPESQPRLLPGPFKVQVRLAKHTKKILSLRLPNAQEVLTKKQEWFDSRYVWVWAVDFPDRCRKILTRNAQVISRFVEAMPDSVRREIVRRMRAGGSA